MRGPNISDKISPGGTDFFIKIGPGGPIFWGDQNFRDSSLSTDVIGK